MNIKTKRTFQRIRDITIIVLLSVGIIGGVSQAFKIFEYFSKATGENANITIDAESNLGGLPRPWRNLAQGGEDKNWRIGNLKQSVKALDPMYIRLDHIYDYYDIVKKENGTLTFNWTAFDLVVSDILATGAKPFISLSYMPPAIAKNGEVTGLPENWGEYQTVIYRTINHLSKERGIEDVYYEVWNEPDLFGEWKMYGEKNYLDLYRVAEKGASQVKGAKTFKFGGSASTALYRNWFDGLAKYASDNNLQLDFLSWHRYTNNVEQFRKDMAEANSWLQSFPKLANTELLITEWGHDSQNNKGYDNAYSAAHTVAVSTELSGIIDKAFVFEIQDGKDPAGSEYWGRWGLFTHESFGTHAKSRYKGLLMLNQLGNTKLQLLGKGTWVKALATKEGETIKVIMANFDPNGSHSETVPFKVNNLSRSEYVVEQQFLDGTRLSNVLPAIDRSVTTQISLRPNTVVMVTLTPQ